MNIASIFQIFWKEGGGGCVAPWILPKQEKSNSSNIISLNEGETPATHTLHNGAFMTKVKLKKKTQQAIGYGWTQNASFVSVFHKKKKTGGPPLPCNRKKILPHHVYRSFEGKNYTQFSGKNQQAIGKNRLRMHHLHPFFKKFLGETPTPPYGNDKTIPLFGFIDPPQLR